LKDEALRALSRVASGQDVVDIAKEEGLTVNAVAAWLDQAIQDLEADNLLEAVTKAIRLGLIEMATERMPKTSEAED
jgi:DNA-binding NarL/FixJ family response regulator